MVLRSSYHGKGGKYNYWDFPKGLLDGKEKGIDAAKREAREEAGIKKYKLFPKFKSTVRYFVRGRPWGSKAAMKFVAMFLAEAKSAKVKLSWEHDAFEWLPYKEARKRITRKEMRRAIEEAEEFLKRPE